MGPLAEFIRRMLGRGEGMAAPLIDEEELRAAFRSRYHSFKLLLTANSKALEIITDLENALRGDQPFGMSFVRSKSTAVCVNVLRMVQHLEELAPTKYSELFSVFEAIRSRLDAILSTGRVARGDRFTAPLADIDATMLDEVGPKMANVAEVRNRLGISVPPGFVVTSAAYDKFIATNDLRTEIDRRIQAAEKEDMEELYTLSANIQQLVIDSPLPEAVERAIMDAYTALERESHDNVRVSVRSSALGEDVAGTGFAGQFRSELNVGPEDIVHAYKEVVAAKYSLPAVAYRLSRGIPDEAVAMCVGVMAMVDAVAGGVMYSRDPLDIRDDSIVINSLWGLPKAVVDGSEEPDLFIVSRRPDLHVERKQIGFKERQFTCDPEEGICRMELTDDEASVPSLTDRQALDLAAVAVKVEDHYGSARDIEWAIDTTGQIVVLQCRPLQQESSVRAVAEPCDESCDGAPLLANGGVTVSRGVASGPVFRVSRESDKLRFPQGAVMVTRQALPTWASLLGRASAVVTEMGGVTGHLATVAREFGVPALFGLPGVMENLADETVVTVDADARGVYEGRVESLLSLVRPKKNLMQGSAVFNTLRSVLELVAPLNILDPDSPEFHPRKCRTLHDITRFIHEKAVEEMFSFCKDHRYSRHASKQMMDKVPMQWWVVDLDDGFKSPIEGKFVRIEDIASIPMLALWEGIIAIPWEGPPPVNAGGFMSVLVQATANPGLDPALSSPYSVRNYFMISKNFCSLSSRFGFHFSTVEALVGDRAAENYVSFVFKGGAADRPRRVKRASLVAGVLEEFGFHVEVKEDGVSARFEGHPEDLVKSRLVILGYLIMHTRQLDMVMADQASVSTYRTRLTDQIKEILQPYPASVTNSRSQ